MPRSTLTTLDLLRAEAIRVVNYLRTAPADRAPGLRIRLRMLQDQIGLQKQRNPLLGHKDSPLAWVDVWSPDT